MIYIYISADVLVMGDVHLVKKTFFVYLIVEHNRRHICSDKYSKCIKEC